ncbi:hypothetical protein AWB69_09005 [Caballeronia udeis]|uniref:Uncharacterized protein n=1 Tax=Caballeronia udeis TaxID=1232866 RepID=A0A158JWR9_9BURK|nr:hypothetical protein AWB69_09005 [Caballeronia udeis]
MSVFYAAVSSVMPAASTLDVVGTCSDATMRHTQAAVCPSGLAVGVRLARWCVPRLGVHGLLPSAHKSLGGAAQGFGHDEAVPENALSVAAKSAQWIISEQDAPVIGRLLALHDRQVSEAPMHRVVEAEKQLRQFLAGTSASPLVRPKSD